MRRVLMLVEGVTEEGFILEILAPHLLNRNVAAIPKIVTTKRVTDAPHFKGGGSQFGKFENDLRLLLRDSNATLVTTMIDYYGLPADFPAPPMPATLSCYEKVKRYEEAFAAKINHDRFLPFLMLHEFEALLFTNPPMLARRFLENDQTKSLQKIRDQYASPEEIDDSPDTAPSKRIKKLLPGYRKRQHGIIAAQDIGIEAMRAACPHFNEWLTKLENL
jgi:hypothetical protein